MDVTHLHRGRPRAGRHGDDRRVRPGRSAVRRHQGGQQFIFDEAVSFQVICETQEEADHYWERLTEGGEEGPCGWLKNRYGLSWQVVPAGMEALLTDPDPQRAQPAMEVMLKMSKLNIATLRAAADGVRPTCDADTV